jgi:hypothetical protein
MTGTVMMERTAQGMPMTTGQTTTPMTTGNWLTVPRCTYKFEKCQGGMKMTCICDDPMARSMMQQLCMALTGGMCSAFCTMNGVTVCQCNFTMGMCKVEMTDTGVCITCTSGDTACCNMIQSCCDCLMCMCDSGCVCCVTMNGNPVCCGYTESQSKKMTTKK